MSEFGDEPVLRVKMEPDASAIDQKLDEIDRRAGQGSTFSSERLGGSRSVLSLPETRQSDVADRMARAMEAAASAAQRFAVSAHSSLGGPDILRGPTGQFVSPASYFNTGWQQFIDQGNVYPALPYGRETVQARARLTTPAQVQMRGDAVWAAAQAEVYDASTQIPGGGGAGWTWGRGGGGGGYYGPGGPPPVGGAGGGENFPLAPIRYPWYDPANPQRINIPNAFEQQVASSNRWRFTRRAGMGILFGTWEAYRAHRAISNANLTTMLAEDPEAGLEAQATGIESASRGVFGGLAALALDAAGVGPERLKQTIEIERSRSRDLDYVATGRLGIRHATEMRLAELGQANVTLTQARQDKENVQAELRIRRGGLANELSNINEDLGKYHTVGLSIFPDVEYYRELRGKQTSLRHRIGVVDSQIRDADAAEKHAGAIYQRNIDVMRLDIESGRDTYADVVGAQPTLTRMGLFSRTANLNTLAATQGVEREALRRRQEVDIAKLMIDPKVGPTSPLILKTREEQAWEMRALETRQETEYVRDSIESQIDRNTFNIANRGAIESSRLRQQFRPIEASIREMQAQRDVAIDKARPEDQQAVRDLGNQLITEFKADVERSRGIQRIGLAASIATTQAEINRDPLGARLTALQGERDVALARLPKDTPNDIRLSVQSEYDKRAVLAIQQDQDSKYLQKMGLTRQEDVTGLLARAYGPAARIRQYQARVREVSGEAEEKAEAILLRDSADVGLAQQERRIGVNRLRAMKAEYMEGFSAQEGSLNRTALTGVGTTNPTEILKSIDDGIKQLNQRMNNGGPGAAD